MLSHMNYALKGLMSRGGLKNGPRLVAKHKVRYALVPGHGHYSIVDASAKAVAEIIAFQLQQKYKFG